MNPRAEFLQQLIDRHGYGRYLEIGAQKGRTFNSLKVDYRVGVEPTRGQAGTFCGTSDQFFKLNCEKFDLVFIDGLHQSEQVLVDVLNSLAALTWNGLIVLHDCNPQAEHKQTHESPGVGGWNGDVWKAFVHLRSKYDLDCACGDFDQGCGVVIRRANTDRIPPVAWAEMTWPALVANREKWLRLMDMDKLHAWIGER